MVKAVLFKPRCPGEVRRRSSECCLTWSMMSRPGGAAFRQDDFDDSTIRMKQFFDDSWAGAGLQPDPGSSLGFTRIRLWHHWWCTFKLARVFLDQRLPALETSRFQMGDAGTPTSGRLHFRNGCRACSVDITFADPCCSTKPHRKALRSSCSLVAPPHTSRVQNF